LWLVVAGGVEGEVAEEFAVLGDDSDVEVGGEDQDRGSGVVSADSDVVESAVVAEGDSSDLVDAVVADSEVFDIA
jgi:hypothetical protein